jgi:hypothetical protein
MAEDKVGRNDPCPCGSGLKYKKCCLGQRRDAPSGQTPADMFAEIRQALQGRDFESLEEANAFLKTHMQQRNQQSVADFAGLSAQQMHQLLYDPFDSPGLVRFSDILSAEPVAPILTLFRLLAEAVGEQGLKPTAKGNLPRHFCREAALAYFGEEACRERTRYGNINKEEDFFDLHVTRLVAEAAGLMRKYKGRFILSRNCRNLLSHNGYAAIHPLLLRAYTQKFNWAYRDRYPEFPFLQQAFLFTLFLLHRHGDQWRDAAFYEDHFLQAFPMLLDEMAPASAYDPEQELRTCYTLRTLECFAQFLGLAELESIPREKSLLHDYRVRKTVLLDEAVRFQGV